MSLHKDDDSTVVRSASTYPTSSGAAPDQSSRASAAGLEADGLSLSVGTRVAEFEVTERIGEGGFSIVYLAMDHSLERVVALKEYMPSSLASRLGNTQVQPRSQRHRDTFELGLTNFIKEARMLARFDHPALVKVHRFWEANGTAYMAMPVYQGTTIKDTVRAMPAPPDEAWLLGLLAPLTEALSVLHGQDCYHRDIAPDNVMLLADGGNPVLLDFGAARRVEGDVTQALTVILKAGYAPVEQYAEVPDMKQGPWTDVYALAAMVYWAIMGKTPPPSVGRMVSDAHVPLMECAAGRYSARFLQAIDRALVVLPDQRTQSIQALRRDLGIESVAPSHPPGPPAWTDTDATVIRPAPPRSSNREADITIHPTTVPPMSSNRDAKPSLLLQPEPARTGPAIEAGKGQSAVAAKRSGLRLALISGTALAVVLAGTGLWWASQSSGPPAKLAPESPRATAPATQGPPHASEPRADTDRAAGQETAPPKAPPVGTAPSDEAKLLQPGPPDPQVRKPMAGQNAQPKVDSKPPQKQPSAECAQILSMLSLEESRPDLLDRYRQLNCR